jgi:tyrosinase
VGLLNDNIRNWLNSTVIVDGKPIGGGHVKDKYAACLDAPNYTVFSNTTSAAQWFDETGVRVVPIESPHNSIHLAVGGFDLPKIFDASPIDGANADMGENDTAGLDPIFFFHHCFVDRVFWLWQQKNGFTDKLDIIPQYPGTNSVDSQGPTPGTAANSWLTLDSPLDPFKLTDRGKKRPYTSQDCINIETQLGYTYGPGSLEPPHIPAAAPAAVATSGSRTISVRGLNRARIRGSFLISAFANVNGERQHIGTEAVLSRWHVDGCANCQTHIEGRVAISMHPLGEAAASITLDQIEVQVRTRDGVLGSEPQIRAMVIAGRHCREEALQGRTAIALAATSLASRPIFGASSGRIERCRMPFPPSATNTSWISVQGPAPAFAFNSTSLRRCHSRIQASTRAEIPSRIALTRLTS